MLENLNTGDQVVVPPKLLSHRPDLTVGPQMFRHLVDRPCGDVDASSVYATGTKALHEKSDCAADVEGAIGAQRLDDRVRDQIEEIDPGGL